MAFAPERVEAALADARAGAAWRAALGVAEPSPQLCEAIDAMAQAVRAATDEGGHPTLDTLLVALGDSRPGEGRLDGLVRRVLQSTLEQRQNRQANEGGRHDEFLSY